MGTLTAEGLELILPYATAARIDLYLPHLIAGMAARGIDTPLRQAHFLAQVGHESGSLRYATEIATGDAYEGRADLGNTQPGDGRRFKGRGLIQLTGRANYAAYGLAIGRDLLAEPTLLSIEPALSVDVACWFWAVHGLNALADADDLAGVTRRINGGLNGFPDRLAILKRARQVLGADKPTRCNDMTALLGILSALTQLVPAIAGLAPLFEKAARGEQFSDVETDQLLAMKKTLDALIEAKLAEIEGRVP